MKNFFEEFKNFAIKGNMIDLAVGIIIGTAFNKVVSTIVSAIIMPPLSLLTDDVNLSNKKWILRQATDSVEEVAIGYGELIESLIDFGIIAFTIFVMVKFINRFKQKSEDPTNKEVETPKNIALLSSLEKLLQEQNEILKNKK
ncbi:MAG: large-conductance mechanosensitive channel protein MscL [Maribacter dokdonensis]|uniref:Large-conductance mechanosensitive channel n=1 Tax=Maribacter dokdonensis TaxID=320912 RepID=A0A1H4RR54_9FLAO|nr:MULTISPECIES: large-conductance mechanosensitive channel protein MscL [Maribacter]KSA13553.1 Large-conductance mechanosensitive channel [Maribacter dokdonensis DSW-8]PHN93749.1 large-conductance mechanosensitive channel protein MscL [Maribacter sp. 6B07]SEC34297.1 large conductance mechanosensitive channel [Maribacter dokdonensis]